MGDTSSFSCRIQFPEENRQMRRQRMPLPGVGEEPFDIFPFVEVKPSFELRYPVTQASGIGKGLRAGPRSAPLDSVKQLRINPPAADQVVSAILGRPHYQIAFGESVEGSTDYARGERG